MTVDDKEQDIKLALKQDIKDALNKESPPPLKPNGAPQTPLGTHSRRTNITLIIGLTTLTASCIVLVVYFVFLWNFINLDHLFDMKINSNTSVTSDSPEDSDGANFLETYNPNQVLNMKPAEREIVYEKAVKQERLEKRDKIAAQINDMGIVLKKTVQGEHGALLAIMTENGGSEKAYSVGDIIAEARVMGIYPKRVILFLNGKKVMLNKEGTAPKEENDDFTSDGLMLISDAREGSLDSLSEEAKDMMARFESGTRFMDELPRGFKINSLQTGPLSYAGLREGDLIISINAIPLQSRPDLVRAYATLKEKSPNPVEFERDGKIMRSDVQL